VPDLPDLLAREAAALDVPAPPTTALLARAKRLRRRHRAVTGAAALATAAVVGGAAALTVGGGTGRGADPAGVPDPLAGPVFTVDTTLYHGAGLDSAAIDDKAVKSLFYTSAGVLVRHGNNPYSDGGGPQRFSLVEPDGTVTRLRLVTEETVHASDPDQPYVAYGENVDGTLQVVVHDVEQDREAARVDVAPTKDDWFPVSIDDGTVFVQNGYDGEVKIVDWHTGEVADSDVLTSVWDVHGGYLGDHDGETPVVRDGRTGEVVLRGEDGGYFEVSPDGRYAGLVDEESQAGEDPTFDVYDLATGDSVTIEGFASDFGWTPEGDLFSVDDALVTTCDTDTGSCTEATFDLPKGSGEAPEVRLGGRTYES